MEFASLTKIAPLILRDMSSHHHQQDHGGRMTSIPKSSPRKPRAKLTHREFLANKFPNRPEPKSDTLIALPLRLIDLIQKRAPTLWTSEDVRFERTLRERVGSGICRNVIFVTEFAGYPDEAGSERQSDAVDKRYHKSQKSISAKERERLRKGGWSEARIDLLQRQQDAFAQKIRDLTKGYLGWLVTEPGFRLELVLFLDEHKAWICNEGRFPEIPQWFFTERVSPSCSTTEAANEESFASMFLQRWGLETLLTPDLPYPIRPQLGGAGLYDLYKLSEIGGLVLYVPWYLFHDQSLTLRDILNRRTTENKPNHLDEWLKKQPDRWGYSRYVAMFDIYVFWLLGLQARYGQRLDGHVRRLEESFAVYLDPTRTSPLEIDKGAEVVRKIRLQMLKRLRKCQQVIDDFIHSSAGPE